MSFLSFINSLFIAPLKLLFELFYYYAYKFTDSAGLSIVVISLIVNFLVLPLYKRADEIQAEEREIQATMAPMIKHLKKTFKGDERFMMLQEYYRINNYKPIYALKSTVSLLLQIPFFIAAYDLTPRVESLHARFNVRQFVHDGCQGHFIGRSLLYAVSHIWLDNPLSDKQEPARVS